MTYKQAKVHVYSCTHTIHTLRHTDVNMQQHSDTCLYTQHTLRHTCSHITYILVHILRHTLVHTHMHSHNLSELRLPILRQSVRPRSVPGHHWLCWELRKHGKYSVKSWMPALGKRMQCHNQGFSSSSIYECESLSSCPVCLLSYNKSDILEELVSLSFPKATMICL